MLPAAGSKVTHSMVLQLSMTQAAHPPGPEAPTPCWLLLLSLQHCWGAPYSNKGKNRCIHICKAPSTMLTGRKCLWCMRSWYYQSLQIASTNLCKQPLKSFISKAQPSLKHPQRPLFAGAPFLQSTKGNPIVAESLETLSKWESGPRHLFDTEECWSFL